MKKNLSLVGLLLVAILASCLVGRYQLSLVDIYNIIVGKHTDTMAIDVFYNIRLARTVLVGLSGLALGVSGFVYQSIFRNPLVSPDVLGVSSGASVGAIIGILFFPAFPKMVQILAFVFALLVVIISMKLARAIGGKKIYSMLLAGIITGTIANSIIMTLKYIADPESQLATIEYWLMGSFHMARWNDVILVLPFIGLSWLILFIIKRQVRAIALGEQEAMSLGVAVKFMYALAVVTSTLLTAVVVSIAGVIGWIGLIVPHMTRIFAGEDYISNFTQTGLMGAITLIVADIMARSLLAAEIPISIFTSFISGIFLIMILYFRKDKKPII